MNKAVEMLKKFGIDYDINVLSAHHTPHEAIATVENSDSDLFIAGAGGMHTFQSLLVLLQNQL